MWDVFGFCKDYIKGRVTIDDFDYVYKRQKPLVRFINQMHAEQANLSSDDKSAEIIVKDCLANKKDEELKAFISDLIKKMEEKYNNSSSCKK